MPEPYSLYVVECRDGRLYTGIAKDPERRFRQHRAGRGAVFTRINGAESLLATKTFGSRSEAAQAEKLLKRKTAVVKKIWAIQNQYKPGSDLRQ